MVSGVAAQSAGHDITPFRERRFHESAEGAAAKHFGIGSDLPILGR
jgi:hypothetical protein